MARAHHMLDGKPGQLPDIRAHAGNITFVMATVGARPDSRLVIRCDADGNVWVSIRSERE